MARLMLLLNPFAGAGMGGGVAILAHTLWAFATGAIQDEVGGALGFAFGAASAGSLLISLIWLFVFLKVVARTPGVGPTTDSSTTPNSLRSVGLIAFGVGGIVGALLAIQLLFFPV